MRSNLQLNVTRITVSHMWRETITRRALRQRIPPPKSNSPLFYHMQSTTISLCVCIYFQKYKNYIKVWLCWSEAWPSPLTRYLWLTRCVWWYLQRSCVFLCFLLLFIIIFAVLGTFLGIGLWDWACSSLPITACRVWGRAGGEKHSNHSGYIAVAASLLSLLCRGCVKVCVCLMCTL